MSMHRRDFLKSSLAASTLVSLGTTTIPGFLGRSARAAIDQVARLDRAADDPLLGFVRRSTLTAYDSSRRLEQVAQPSAGRSKYPAFGLARRLELIAQV